MAESPSDYRRAVSAVIPCGGDADTTAAIVGSIVGSGVGRAGIPTAWADRIWEWPRSVPWMTHLAEATSKAVTSGVPSAPPKVFPLVGYARNAVFLTVVLAHVARRLFPPY